jgi:copper(I)-binding protein
MRPLFPLAVALIAPVILLAGCEAPSNNSVVVSRNAVVRLAAVPGRPAAGYMTASASLDHVALVSVSSPKAERIEIHETMSSGSMSSMHAMERIEIKEGEEIILEPGGRHLMLFGVDPAVKPGDKMPLTLHFAKGGVASLSARVIAAGDEVPE